MSTFFEPVLTGTRPSVSEGPRCPWCLRTTRGSGNGVATVWSKEDNNKKGAEMNHQRTKISLYSGSHHGFPKQTLLSWRRIRWRISEWLVVDQLSTISLLPTPFCMSFSSDIGCKPRGPLITPATSCNKSVIGSATFASTARLASWYSS